MTFFKISVSDLFNEGVESSLINYLPVLMTIFGVFLFFGRPRYISKASVNLRNVIEWGVNNVMSPPCLKGTHQYSPTTPLTN